MISVDKTGGRTVHLLIPFEFQGKKVESVVLSPVLLGHSLRWAEGDWKSSIAFLTELAGVDEAIIRSLRYPDADRVMEMFLSMLPPDIRQDISEGRIPVKPVDVNKEEGDGTAAETHETNGGGKQMTPQQALAAVTAMQARTMQGPGVPLPQGETGFDMSDEQP